MTYRHLTQAQRYQISALKALDFNHRQIALKIGCHRSSIDREVARHASAAGYCPELAHQQAQTTRQHSNAAKLNPAYWALVQEYLRLDMSPQQISGRLRAEQSICISHESIYQYIYQQQRQGLDLVRYLRCQKVRRKRYGAGRQRRGQIAGRVSIEQRPSVVDEKSRMGDWEGDTVVGKNHQGFLVTVVERKSRYTVAAQLDTKEAHPVAQAIIDLLRPYKSRCHTLTFDNGQEFAQHRFISQCLDAKVYFAHPYCSWERGLNENTNGLLRQYFPKGTNLRQVTQSQLDDAVYALNHRPRKCLGYKTPHEVFFGYKIRPFKILDVALRA